MKTLSYVDLLYRIGRSTGPWDLPDWKYAPFRGRFDDPAQRYRVRYAALSAHGAFVEKLATFRPDLKTLLAIANVDGSEPVPRIAAVPASFFADYALGRARADLPADNGIVDLSTASAMTAAVAVIESASRAVGRRIESYDAATLLENNRPFTQAISSTIFESGFAGIAYRSRFEPSEICVALFEGRHQLYNDEQDPIEPGDRAFLAGCAAHGIAVAAHTTSAAD